MGTHSLATRNRSILRSTRSGCGVLLLAATVVAMAGCFNPFNPDELTSGIRSTQPPTPDTPSNTLRLLEWCYNNRAIAEYRELFTDDFRFQFGARDPFGNAYRDNPWTREDELASATKLFQGSSDKQAAISITLTLDKNITVQADQRPGKNPRWHKTILTSQVLTILEADQIRRDVTGSSLFFLVRGDSAVIPQELQDRGFGPDTTRWYIDRWEDLSTVEAGGVMSGQVGDRRARPAGTAVYWATWGEIKLRWR